MASVEEVITLDNIAVHVSRIEIRGAQRTRPDLLKVAASRAFFSCQRFSELAMALQQFTSKISSMDAFKSCECVIDKCKSNDRNYSIFVYLKESRLAGNMQTVAGPRNKPSLSMGLSYPNLLGVADSLRATHNYAGRGEQETMISWNGPVGLNPLYRWNFGFVQRTSEMPWCSTADFHTGPYVSFSFPSKLRNAEHTVIAECLGRQLGPMGDSCPTLPVRLQFGNYLRISFKHLLQWDSRDSLAVASAGSLVRLTQELDVGANPFVKGELDVSKYFSVGRWLSFQTSFSTGSVTNLPRASNVSLTHTFQAIPGVLSERFFLGGPYGLRGYEPNSVGLRADKDCLGTNFYTFGAFHVYLNKRLVQFITPHLFISAGAFAPELALFDSFSLNRTATELPAGDTDPIRRGHIVSHLRSSVRASYGLGLVFNFQGIRLEVNYCLPLFKRPGDVFSSFQFGLGYHFL